MKYQPVLVRIRPFICIQISRMIYYVCPDCYGSPGLSTYRQIHDNILPKKSHDDLSLVNNAAAAFASPQKATTNEISKLQATVLSSESTGISAGIDKNVILEEYTQACSMKEGLSRQVTSSNKGEPTNLPNYPTIAQLVRDCQMKPSLNHQYRVEGLILQNVIVIILRESDGFLSPIDIKNLSAVNSLYNEVIRDVCLFRKLDFSPLREPRIGYADQQAIQQARVDMATAAMIHYGLHPGMLIRYLKGEYIGESRNIAAILQAVSPHINEDDTNHIRRILTQGCPSKLILSEPNDMKFKMIAQGNQQTFQMYPEAVTKTMNKEERHSHLIPVKLWVLLCSPYARATSQGMQIKPGKNPRIIWDGSTKTLPEHLVLNEETSTEFEAVIDFGQAKKKLLISIYNWRISFPTETIYIALADITACFRFPRIAADITGAFGFVADGKYFVVNSHVFGSNTSCSSWEPFRRGIQALIRVYLERTDLVDKHAELLALLKWDDLLEDSPAVTPAIPCALNQGVLDLDGNIIPTQGNIYVDDILGAGVSRGYMNRLLAATIEAIFTVCGEPQIQLRQCPLSLEKWLEMLISPNQIVLGLYINTNKMTIGITQEYCEQVKSMLNDNWTSKRRFFRASDMQKLIGKIARLGEGAPWIFKLMSHIYTSLAFALQNNKTLLKISSHKFKTLISQIQRKHFVGNQADIAKEINFALKLAAKLVNNNKHLYRVNETMREELEFIRQALDDNSGIKFETPIAFIIPRMPTACLFGDSSLLSCGGYSIELKIWWFLPFPKQVISRTLLHLKNNKDQTFISINCLEFVTIIINYCAALTAFYEDSITADPYPVVLCVTDNISAKNWTTHTSKKSIIGRALARFFCGLLIGSNVGINAKWISTLHNKIADDVSRLKATNPSIDTSHYDFAKLKQDHKELKTCRFFHPSPKLLSMIWKILLTRSCPALSEVLQMRPPDLGKLSS